MKKITLSLGLVFASLYSQAQGLDTIIVEKYYQANAADVATATAQGAIVPLTVNSVTYRVYADLAPGYKLLQVWGNSNHTLNISTTTAFFNDPDNGVPSGPQSLTLAKTKTRTTLLDSWLTIGGVMSGKVGVLKSEDTDGSIGNTQGLLANNPGGAFGLPIMGAGAQDGLLPLTVSAPGLIGISAAQIDAFDQNANYDATPGFHAANSFTANGGSISTPGGVVGATASNMVLIGQFTTDGVFSFTLNLQIQPTAGGAALNYVPDNVKANEVQSNTLIYPYPITIGVKDKNNTATQSIISVYPNPTKDVFTLTASINKESVNNSYSVYNAMGSLISYKNLSSISNTFTHTIDLSAYPSGLYFVSASIDGVNSIKKIVKE